MVGPGPEPCVIRDVEGDIFPTTTKYPCGSCESCFAHEEERQKSRDSYHEQLIRRRELLEKYPNLCASIQEYASLDEEGKRKVENNVKRTRRLKMRNGKKKQK